MFLITHCVFRLLYLKNIKMFPGGRQHEDCSLSVLKFLLSHRECLIDYVLDNDIDYTNIQVGCQILCLQLM